MFDSIVLIRHYLAIEMSDHIWLGNTTIFILTESSQRSCS
jgi:hypothetical protein